MLNWSAKRLQKLKYLYKGHPTTKCFQIRQKSLKRFFFSNVLEACLVILELPYHLFICSDVVLEL